MSNFLTSKAKRREQAKKEAKKKREERVEKIKEVAGLVGTGIVSGVKTAKENLKDWNERRKERNLERINKIYARLTASYQTKEEQMDNLREEVDTFVKENTEEVPGPKDPIIETDEVKVEIVEPENAGRPGNAVVGEGTKTSKEGPEPGDR
jgi:GTP-dependent phosphoenolpyruvate carboxykinase